MMNKTLLDQIRKGNIEVTRSGILLPVMKARLAGEWRVRKNDEAWDIFHNVVTIEGATDMLNVMFHGGSQTPFWNVGLYENVFTPSIGLTASDIVTTLGENIAYVNATRPQWDEAAAASGSITDSTVTEFTSNADSQTITGAFLVNNATKSATSGILFSVANFTTAKPLDSGDKLSVGYTLVAQDVSV